MPPRCRWLRYACVGLCVAFLPALTAAQPRSDAKRKLVAKACKEYQGFDLNGDGLIEIERVRPLMGARCRACGG